MNREVSIYRIVRYSVYKYSLRFRTAVWLQDQRAMQTTLSCGASWFNVRNASVSARTRHWELWQQFVRECYLRLLITIHLVSTTEECADILTKALPKEDYRFKKFRNILMNITD